MNFELLIKLAEKCHYEFKETSWDLREKLTVEEKKICQVFSVFIGVRGTNLKLIREIILKKEPSSVEQIDILSREVLKICTKYSCGPGKLGSCFPEAQLRGIASAERVDLDKVRRLQISGILFGTTYDQFLEANLRFLNGVRGDERLFQRLAPLIWEDKRSNKVAEVIRRDLVKHAYIKKIEEAFERERE